MLLAAGKALAAGVISAKVVALTEGVLKAMLLTKLKIAITVVMTLNLIGAGVGLVYCQTAGSGQTGKETPITVQAKDRTVRAQQQPTPKPDSKVADGIQPRANQVQQLPAELVAAWIKAGARVCWVSSDQDSSLHTWNFWHDTPKGEPDEVPAFLFSRWPAGGVAALPQPQTAFGLYVLPTFEKDENGPPGPPVGKFEHPSPRFKVVYHAQPTDAQLKELAGLKSLRCLDLNNTNVTDAVLKVLAGLKSLQSLDLTGTKLTDAGLKELARLKNLRSLNLQDTQVTGVGLKELAGLESLQTLGLGYTKVADAELKVLAGLKSLQTLYLEGTPGDRCGAEGASRAEAENIGPSFRPDRPQS